MSKGHSVPTQYAVLSLLGVIKDSELPTIKTLGSRLQGHPDIQKTKGIEAPTGSLGQGLSYVNGMALAARLDNLNSNFYVIMGDGEMQEGQVWEAAMTSAHYHLNNICVIVDRNRFQSQGEVSRMMRVDPLVEKWKSFGWKALEIDGHALDQICAALDMVNGQNNDPFVIIADTVKGKGVSFMENTYKYHNLQISKQEYLKARSEIVESIKRAEIG
jgi:transketolase